MDWFRFHTKTLESKKAQALSGNLFKAWVNLLCIARIFDGVIPPIAEVAFRLRCSEKQASCWIKELLKYHLLDETAEGEIVPHDWDEHQKVSDDAARRKREQRAKRRVDKSRDTVGTCPVVEQTRAEQTRTEQTRTEQTTAEREPPISETVGELPIAHEHPEFKREIIERFPDTDTPMLLSIIDKSVQAILSAGGNPRELTDRALAEAVRVCTKKDQYSAGLYCKTIPKCIANWATTD